ncbi:hypothetical protein M431DRAFT_152697 [Trichoderma harzianum CBS 226.95]|uniref:Uncharacterized protein n=1 Tax=Trichoderma harzianum CBS 226.95 TaxID=983964 RepID=A0A2T3ZY43_TRIHA|nr:hypothetical protein M431DRAFT_152697 [Trichoderma harzianum CBS 226.95]PTB49735.1 hypothetical protein M431DRAFT_152697 [Trichoderma harzianum CBS 226.95]
MSSVSTRRAPKSQGGLARLVSKFENLGASKTPQDIGSAGEIRHDPISASKFSDAPPVQKNARDRVVGSSKTLASPSLTPTSATRDQLETPLKDSHAGTTAPPSSKIGKLISRRGLAVADMRRLFERGNDKNVTSNVARTTTYEPKRVASPITTTECNDPKTFSLANSPMKGSSAVNDSGTLANRQEERDIVPDLVEHSEYLPRPLTSPDRFSRPPREDKAAIEDNKSTWQRNEPRFKIRGGVFLHNTPVPLQNMVVTDVGTWRPNPLDTSELALHSEDRKLRNDDQHLVHSFERVKGDGSELLENLQSGVTLCYPCRDIVLSSMTYTDGDAKEPRGQGGLLFPTSRSFPPQQSKVSNLRRKFDSALPSSTSSKPIISQQSSVRPTSTQDGTQPPRFGTLSGTGRKLKETIGLFESMSHQANRDDRFGNIPKISSSPTFQRTAATKGKLASDKLERAAAKSEDVPPPPRLLSPIEDRPPRPYARSPGVHSASSQASDIKPLLYTTPSMIKTKRHEKHFGSLFRSGWRRKAKLRSEDDAVQRQRYNIDGEAGLDFEQKYHKLSCDETWTDGSEASSTTHEPMIAERHPSLRLLRRRLMSRSHGLFVSEAHCTLEQPQPVRSNELRNLPSLFRERMAVLRARAQTE